MEQLKGALKAVIFDMDGTIITTESAWQQATKYLLKTKGFLTDQECNDLAKMVDILVSTLEKKR